MNERIRELLNQAEERYPRHLAVAVPEVVLRQDALEKFAQLIVRECINQAHSVGDLRGANDDMIYGADTAAVKISKHFGFEE